MKAFLIQDGSYIDASLDEVVGTYGSFAGYLNELNIEGEGFQKALLADG